MTDSYRLLSRMVARDMHTKHGTDEFARSSAPGALANANCGPQRVLTKAINCQPQLCHQKPEIAA